MVLKLHFFIFNSHTKVMQPHFFVLSFMLVFLIVLVFPVFLRLDLRFNALGNSGFVGLRLFGLPVYKAQIKFSKNQLIITSKKEKALPLDLKDEKVRFLNKFFYLLFLKIKIQKLLLHFEVGK